MITLLHTESSLGWGGQEQRTLRELLGISRNSFRPFLACRPQSRIGKEARAQGIEVTPVQMRGNFDPWAVLKLMSLYQKKRVDIVHTHSTADSWIASTAAKLSSRRPKVVRTRHLSCAFNNRLIYNFMADRVITVGKSTRQYMIREKKIREEKVLTIPTGVDLDRFDPAGVQKNLREELGLSPQIPIFGTVAVFRRLKGHQYLLEATRIILRSCPEARVLLVGDGPQKKNLLRVIEANGLRSAVIMPGFREDVAQVLKTLDVFVFPSIEEALGTAILEAMAMERPIVATRVGGIPEIVREGENGFLVDPEDAEALAARIIFLLQHKEMGEEMGKRGRQFVETYHDNRSMVSRLEELYFTLWGSHPQ
jgi:glycosyltransferase involved in cell wall biosynthesis